MLYKTILATSFAAAIAVPLSIAPEDTRLQDIVAREAAVAKREASVAKLEATLAATDEPADKPADENPYTDLIAADSTGSSEKFPEYSWERSSKLGFPESSRDNTALPESAGTATSGHYKCYNPPTDEIKDWGNAGNDDEAAQYCMEYCLEKAASKSDCAAMWVYKSSGPYGAYRCCPKTAAGTTGTAWSPAYTTGFWYTIKYEPKPAVPEPTGFCASGVSTMKPSRGPKPWDKCCDASCGECGGPGCSKRPGGAAGCCVGKWTDDCAGATSTRCKRGSGSYAAE